MEGSKEEIRKRMLRFRSNLSNEDVEYMSEIICEKLASIDEVREAKIVMGYYPIRKEVNILPLLIKLSKEKLVLLPFTSKSEMKIIPAIFNPSKKLTQDDYGIPAPSIEERYSGIIDVILTPGLAFDTALHRLGYGKGFYDKFLRENRGVRIGVAYDFQILDALPVNHNDITLDILISEKRIVRNDRRRKS
ncbi:MAG TPA: 5-formyltetrahydrofolate cyclo-ligase [Geobacterales bacterium]|nr:5-formyltetrahydrofolate cyclo-ligase [Geobacterales bacterium]